MTNPMDSLDDIVVLEDDEIELTQDVEATPLPSSQIEASTPAWKVMVVDDDVEVHQATKLALRNFTFEGKPLIFISTYSGAEAKQLIQAHPDTALILLDVVMETHNAGLKVVQYIRQELKNKLVRVILRTGQPGEAPEEAVILDYDINDYKLKVDLTRQRLLTTVITALRSYQDVTRLSQALHNLEQAQLQIVQSEKMSALGNLVAGVAHEISNPVNFIAGNLTPIQNYFQDLFDLMNLYHQHYPNPTPDIRDKIVEVDLEYLQEDLSKLLTSMQIGTARICQMSDSLRIFSRADTASKIAANIHEGIDSTLMILKHRLKANHCRPAIQVIKHYGDIPLVNCYLGQLNQVFMNILANAIDALEESNKGRSYAEIQTDCNRIVIHTDVVFQPSPRIDQKASPVPHVRIRIQDNGLGMSEEIQQKVFACQFTTKPVGKGTGLGLAIAHQIIVDKHLGSIAVNSSPDRGTEFAIALPVE